jgi:hypothetical protein
MSLLITSNSYETKFAGIIKLLEDNNPRDCYAYYSDLVIRPNALHIFTEINISLSLPFLLDTGDAIKVYLPGISNSRARYALES